MSSRDTRVYVGNLPPDIRQKDVEDLFYKYGTITFVDLKNRRGPPFAFIEFKDPRDAKDAVHARDGYDYDGYRLRVEFPRGKERGPGGLFMRNGGMDRGGGRGGDRGGGGRGGGGPTRRSNYRVKITGLPPTGSWQDLKDHMREAGDVCYADVFKDGTGVVEFLRYDDMKYAIKKLDDSRFRSHEGEVGYIRIQEESSDDRNGRDNFRRSRSRSRSPRPGRSRSSPTYSPARDIRRRSPSRSDDESDRSESEKSRSRSRSRSPLSPANGNTTANGNGSDRSHSRSKSKSRSPSRSRSATPESRSPSRSRSRSGSRD